MALLSAAFNVTTRFLKWAVLPVACFLFCFSTAYAAGWVSRTRPDAPDAALCQALLYRLNHTRPGCTATAVAAYPGFKSPPWKTLDASKYIQLIAKLGYVASPGWPNTLRANPIPNWKYALEGAKEFVQKGGTLQIWRTRLLTYFGDGRGTEAPPGDQTIALLSVRNGVFPSPGCPDSAGFRWNRTFVVLPDLSGPDPRVGYGIASLLRNNYPVLYKGRTLLINHIAPPVIISDTTYVPNGTGCWFDDDGDN